MTSPFQIHRQSFRSVLIACVGALLALVLVAPATAQEKAGSQSAKTAKQGAAAQNSQRSAGAEAKGSKFAERDSPEQIRKREEWFYKQRAFPNPHIPTGARLRAFQHMQRMMEAEGKLVRRPDGTFAAAIPNIILGGAWTSLGPAPTTGGLFSPVSGRVTTIAVDPSDTSGDTVLVGGAQGGIWRSIDGGATWTATGDTNPSLAMGSIAFAPSACMASPGACTVYAGTGEQADVAFDIYYGAGVLKSTDHGQTWTQTCTIPSPTCPFIGPFTNTINFGFFNDGGARISYLAVNPSNANLLLVGAQIPRVGTSLSERAGGIYCSDDGGATWSSLLLGGAGTFVGFANSTTAYAAIGRALGSTGTSPNGIYKSTNANGLCSAITFGPTATQPTTSAMGRIDLGIFDANTVYASVSSAANFSSTNLGVFKTVNGGTSWTLTGAPDICRFQCWFDNVVKVDPSTSSTVFFGGSASNQNGGFPWVMRSTDGGTTWSAAIPNSIGPGLPHFDQHAMAFFRATMGTFSGKMRMYLGNDGGVWRTDDAEAATVAWTNVNNNLTLTQFYPNLSFSSANPNLLYAGAQDNGSQFFNGGVAWVDNNQCGDGGQTAVDFLTPTVVYATCQRIDINVSRTGGQDPSSFVFSVNGIDFFNDFVSFIPPISADPSTAGRAYFGTDHVYQTNGFATNWTAISGALPSFGFVLTTIAAAPKNPAVVYAGSDDGLVFVATNVSAGTPATFNPVGGGALPTRTVTAVVPDPNDVSGLTAYVTFSGFAVGADKLGHIFQTINGGSTWIDISCHVPDCTAPPLTDLPNIPVNDLVVDPDVVGTLYAATDLGVFATNDGGATWSTLDTGLPNVASLSLRLHEPSRTLLATTHGRGAWQLLLNNFTFVGPHVGSLSPTSVQAPASSNLTLTVSGSGLTGGTVQWKTGTTTNLATTPVSDTQLTATVPTSLLSAGGTAQVSVAVGAQTSNSLTFSTLAGAPTLTSVSPPSTPVQRPPTTPVMVTLTGTGFATGAKVALNGSTSGITVTDNSGVPTTLKAQLAASLLGPFGSTNDMTVINPPPGNGGTSAPQTFVVVAPPPVNDNFANALLLTNPSVQLVEDTSGATTESTDPTPACVQQFTPAQGNTGGHANGAYNTVWFKFTAPTNGTVNVDTSSLPPGSNYDTTLSVWTGTAGSLTAVAGACNDDIVLGVVLTSQVSFNATSGTTYFIMAGSFGPPDPNPIALGGQLDFTFLFTASPDFTLTPTGQTTVTVNAGSPASFTIALAAQNGFSAAVNFTCSLPVAGAHTTCTPNPASQTPGNNVTINITTTARGGVPPAVPWRTRPWPILVPLVALVAVLLVLLSKVKARRVRLALSLPLAAVLLLLVFEAAGCGGGGGGGGGGGTPAGTYTVTVTGTSGATSHNTTVTLKVN